MDRQGQARWPIRRLGRVAATVAGIGVMLAFAAPIFFTSRTSLIVSPLAALAAALSLDDLTDAIAGAALGVLAGAAAAPLVSALPWAEPAAWLPEAALTAVLSAAAAVAVRFAVRRAPRLERALTIGALAIVLVAGWSQTISVVSQPAKDGTRISALFQRPPVLEKAPGDAYVYLNYLKRLRDGKDYYRAVAETLQEANSRTLRFDAASPLSYRLPTLYRLLAALPGGLTPFITMMLLGSAAAVAAFVLARRYAALPLALASAAMVTAFYAGTAGKLSLLFPEAWAGAFGLLSVVLLIESRARSRRTFLVAGSVAAAAVSALFRELGVAFLVLGLASSLLGEGDRRRAWIPWAAALVVIAGVYAAHWSAASAVVRSMHLPGVTYVRVPWLHADGLGLPAALYLMTYELAARPMAGWVVVGAASISTLMAPRDRWERLVLGTSVIGGCVLLAVLYPTGYWTNGLPPGYWGGMAAPLVLACAPLALAPLPGGRRAGGSEAHTAGEDSLRPAAA